jgi:hypothetical protein
MLALAQAPQAFDEQGKLKDSELRARLWKLVNGYLDMGKRLTG